MIQAPGCLRLAFESLNALLFLNRRRAPRYYQLLHRDAAIHERVIRFVDNVIRTRNFPDDLVLTQR